MLLTPSPRIRTLLAGTTVALCSGTNYVFSAYAPQLASRCGLSSTQLNLVGIAGNLGVYTSGPVWGVIIDRGQQRAVLCCAAVLIAFGYGGIRAVYIHAASPAAHDNAFTTTTPIHASTQTVAMLCLCMLFTGCAGAGGLNASLNVVSRSYPVHQRGTALGITLAGFGLSAFIFSTLAHAVFPGRTEAFLALLACGTALGMCVGVMGVRTVPVLPEEEEEHQAAQGYARVEQEEEGYLDIDTPAGGVAGPVVESEPEDYLTHTHHRLHTHPHSQMHEEVPLTVSRSRSTDVLRSSIDLLPARSRSSAEYVHPLDEVLLDASRELGGVEKQVDVDDGQVSGKKLFVSPDFWVIVVILTLLSGTGLMYINNVGSVVLALANAPSAVGPGGGGVDPIQVAKVQATQVSVVSIWNCLGRIMMGLVSDFAKTRYGIDRVWFIPTIALLFLASQLSAQMTQDMFTLSRVSGLLGTAYGMLFALLPIIVLEWFGLCKFHSGQMV
ncbi:hypothetical protein QFC22_005591 [Naganishia vaughanmartiniae]|uniref:Uncharacterized protein n=1 Tax=Naganishia vaughanmartiniae TaxID=1424756 RepID=A0ACC2WSH7_9TREE|nr:hypothetical protein QFC22_005591 [Naganishia vaughanmartiniae]